MKARAPRAAVLVCLALLLGSCHGSLSGPFIELTLLSLPPSTVKVEVDVSIGNVTKTVAGAPGAESPQVTISFPADQRGLLFLALRAIDATPCLVGTGSVTVMLADNQVYPAVIVSTALPMGCQSPTGKDVVTVVTAGDGQGTVTSSDLAINCGTACTGMFAPGSVVTLTATPSKSPTGRSYQFVSWSGVGQSCTTAPTCQFQISAQQQSITANFKCSGFCPESPSGLNNDLYGIWGFTSGKVVAVGAQGTILQWNGTTWGPVTSGTGTSLRAVHGISSGIGVAVGDNGVILRTVDAGANWLAMTSNTTRNLRGILVRTANNAYAVGDEIGNNMPFLVYSMNAWSPVSAGGLAGSMLNSIFMADGTYFIVAGNGGRMVRVPFADPTSLTFVYNPGNNVNGLWGSAINNMLAVGAASTLASFDATSAAGSMQVAPSMGVTMHAIYGFDASNIYAVGDEGAVWYYNGNKWTAVASGAGMTSLYGIWGKSAQDYYIVGQGGLLWHYRP